ncbi:transposase [Streptomyces sp. NPDC048623]|uniref:transposase n=1 Tax=Streptomyces sp. NPDC048623 TaxID=3155761 RepID=UPI00343599EC
MPVRGPAPARLPGRPGPAPQARRPRGPRTGLRRRRAGQGITSAGVQRQFSGTADRTENSQIGVFAAYATTRGRTLVDRELYPPKSSAEDRARCRAATVPDEWEFATKGELARRMVLRALASPLLIAWVTADSVYGQESRFRRLL